jgi:hypothetical protein
MTHAHEWGGVEISRFSGNPHRKCKLYGCNIITLDVDDPNEDVPLIRGTDDGSLGSCGCIDYHYADCPTRGGVNAYGDESDYEEEEWR